MKAKSRIFSLYWGRKIPIYKMAYLKVIFCEKPVFIITNDYHTEAFEEFVSVFSTNIFDIPTYYFTGRETEYTKLDWLFHPEKED